MCTTTRAKKVIVGLTLVALIAQTVNSVCWYQYGIQIADDIYIVVLYVVMPVIVFIINAIVVREVRRRASSDAASNLGLQHQQSTSSNSAVPTVMLVTTSLVYVLLNSAWSISFMVWRYAGVYTYQYYVIALGLSRFIYTYNFYVYLMTGKQFRADLLTLVCCCCCRSSSSSSAAAAANVRVARRDQAETVV